MTPSVQQHEVSRKVGADGRVTLQFRSDPATLRPVRLALEEYGKEAGLSPEATDAIGLALNEALANVMRHAYRGATDRPIDVTFERRPSGDRRHVAVAVLIRDWGTPFDPNKVPPKPPVDPSKLDSLDDLTPGGLGLMCIKELMDDVRYERQPDGMLLTMVKDVGAENSADGR
jgi:anti-sigma regulatory factor (Ser/Thr protein kinase)